MRAILAFASIIAALSVTAGARAQDALSESWRLGLGKETFVANRPETPTTRIEIGWNGSFVAWRWNPIRVHITGGDRPVGGQVIVEHTGNSSGAVRIATPYGVGPGSTTTVEALVPIGTIIDHLVVVVTDESGRPLRRTAFQDWREPSLVAPPVETSVVPVGVVGTATVARAAGAWAALDAEVEEGDEGASTALADAMRIAPREAASLPTEPMGYHALDALVIGPDALLAAPEGSVRAARAWVERGGRIVLVAGGAGADWRRWLPPDLLEVGELRAAGGEGATRSMALTAEATRLGWRVDAPESLSGLLMADGPVGLGWAVVLTASPEGAQQSVAGAWDAVLGDLLADRLRAIAAQQESYWWAYRSPVGVDVALDTLAHDLGVGAGATIWPVLLGLALLAVLLGPVDWFVLKRLRLRHRSWLTALAWIGTASALAYALPLATLSMETGVRVVAVEDSVAGADAAVRTAALGVLPGSGGVAMLDEGARPSWWRPVNAGWNRPQFQGATPLAQGPGAALGAAPLAVSLRIRSLRTLQEDGVAPAPGVVTVQRVDAGYVVNLPIGVGSPSSAVLHAPDGWWALTADGDGGLRTVEAAQSAMPRAWKPVAERSEPPWLTHETSLAAPIDAPSAALGLPEARRRAWLLERRVERGWGIVYLAWNDVPSRRGIAGAPEAIERRVLRIAAPISSERSEAAP